MPEEAPEPNSLSETVDKPDAVDIAPDDQINQEHPLSKIGRDLHSLLVETAISEGKLVCGACGHEYAVKEGIANFLLPSHLV